jgi:hypothetical protein
VEQVKSNKIQTLIEIFEKRYPIKINDLAAFEYEAKFVNADYAARMDAIIANYVKYLYSTGNKARSPVEFIKYHHYKDDFKQLKKIK